jgi:hypothetical protein
MLPVQIQGDTVAIGRHCRVSFQRTLRIPDDGRAYPLPPGLGSFPLRRVEDYADRVPDSWRRQGGVFVPMYQREALWLNFEGAGWRPNAMKVGIGKVNAISGTPLTMGMAPGKQDYVVVPDQPWLDGIKNAAGQVRQFIAMPLGMGYTIEGQVTGKEEFGGIQIVVYDPKPGRFPDEAPRRQREFSAMMCECSLPAPSMGIAAGGRITQKIYPDAYGRKTWDAENYGRIYVHIVNSMMYREITGENPPSSPVSARSYAAYGYPWFSLYDEGRGDVAGGEALAEVSSVKEKDAEHGFTPQQDDEPVAVDPGTIVELTHGKNCSDGTW